MRKQVVALRQTPFAATTRSRTVLTLAGRLATGLDVSARSGGRVKMT